MAKDSNLNSKPLLFGDSQLDATAIEDIEKFEDAGFDWSYVPGYSEQRRMNELRVRDGHKALPQDKLYWVRVARTDGSNVDYREQVTTARLGYRPCRLEDLKERGWGMPPTAHVAEDGTIRREDVALAIVDSDRANKNRVRQEQVNADFEGRDSGTDEVHSRIEKGGHGSLNEAKQALLASK